MNIDIDSLKKDLIGTTVPRPISGTLSGHAAGEPFDKHVYRFIRDKYPTCTFRQFEYLNKLYTDNLRALSVVDRLGLVRPMAVGFLLNRGRLTTQNWSLTSVFEEKQNDTADILVVSDGVYNIIDVKTSSMAKNSQPPNIISAYKLAQMCALMLEDENFSSHSITYIGIAWKLEGDNLECSDVAIKELFKADPTRLYINWAAAMQVQFHVRSLDQNYSGDVEQWCREYLVTFVSQARERVRTMVERFVDPFQKFLE